MPNLLSPHPNRKRRSFAMFCGSLVFHGALVGTAALWVHPADTPTKIETTEIFIPPGDDPQPINTGSELPAAPVQPEPVAPTVQDSNPVNDAPPIVDQEITDPSTPRPVSPPRNTPARKITNASRAAVPGAQGSGSSSHPGTMAGSPGSGLGTTTGWRIPKPPYPYALRSQRIQGVARIKITTDSTGRVSDAVILKSTGNSSLDENTIQRVRAEWSGPPNASTVREVEYKIQ